MEPARKFKIIVDSKECGTCSGSSPSVVAKKVVKKLCGSSSKMVKFSLKECKRGCERVCGPYQGRMEKLDRPYKRGGKTITHRVICGKVRKMRAGSIIHSDDTIRDFRNRIANDYLTYNPELLSKNKENTIYDHFTDELLTEIFKLTDPDYLRVYEKKEDAINSCRIVMAFNYARLYNQLHRLKI